VLAFIGDGKGLGGGVGDSKGGGNNRLILQVVIDNWREMVISKNTLILLSTFLKQFVHWQALGYHIQDIILPL
jgi:hypothetical protein